MVVRKFPTRRKKKSPTDLLQLYGSNLVNLHKVAEFMHLPDNLQSKNRMLDFFITAESSTEARFKLVGKNLIEAKYGKVVIALYNWRTYRLPGGSYTPDWNFMLENGKWVNVEIKASKLQSGYRDARSKLRAAATLNPWEIFIETMPDKNELAGWSLEEIPPDKEFMQTLFDVGGEL